MDDRIIVCKKDDVSITALFRGNICHRILMSKSDRDFRIGNIYTGRIEKLVDNVKAAFVDIGFEQNVYVPFEKMQMPLTLPAHSDGKIHEGDKILVQIERMPSKNKPASAAGDFSLVGNSVVLFYGRKGISFSKKINDSAFRESKKINYFDFESLGLMFRTNAPYYSDSVIQEEVQDLKRIYDAILKDFSHSLPGKCLYKGLQENLCIFRDEYIRDIKEIVVEETEIYSYLKNLPSFNNIDIRLHQDSSVSLYHIYDLKKVINDALARRVWLKSGAYLVFDNTEALTVIDVNSGKASAAKSGKNILHRINLEAAEEILHQIALRNLSGIIIVDFINSDGNGDTAELLHYLEDKTYGDRVHTRIVDITKLGLAELTREKTDAPLSEVVKSLNFIP